MKLEGLNRLGFIFYVVSNYSQRLHRIEINGHLYISSIIPITKTLLRQPLPWEISIRIHFSARCYIGMTDKISDRNVECILQTLQYIKQADDLLLGEWFRSVIIQFNSYTDAVKIREAPPFTNTGMMTTEQIVQHMEHCSVFADNIMRTYRCMGLRECLQRLVTTVLRRVMDDHIIGATH